MSGAPTGEGGSAPAARLGASGDGFRLPLKSDPERGHNEGITGSIYRLLHYISVVYITIIAARQPLHVQACIPELAVGALHRRNLDRLSTLNLAQLHSDPLGRQPHGRAPKLLPVVDSDRFRTSTLHCQAIQQPTDPLAGDRNVHDLSYAFPAVVIQDVEDADSPPRRQLIRQEI